MQPRYRLFLVNAFLALLMLAGYATQIRAEPQSSAATTQTAGQHVVYLPTVNKPNTMPPSGGGAGDSANFWLPTKADDGAGIATNNPQVAVDSAGGIHVAYRISARTTNGPWPAYYMHCAANCADPAQWFRIALSDGIVDVRLQLDAAGHPRLLLKTYVTSSTKELQYVACDGNCGNRSSWTVTPVATTFYGEMYIDEKTNHYFALDHAGRPGFVYMDFMNPGDHNGTFYAYCPAADPRSCIDAANWDETRISQQNLIVGDLVYTSDNQARFLMQYTPDDYAVKLVYIECDATCSDLRYVQLWDTDGYAHWSLRLDTADRPRFALYSGWHVNDIPSHQIFYVWCDANCLTATSWRTTPLTPQMPAQQQLDMQLDAQGRPRIVFGTSYTWCSANCQSHLGAWQAKVVETSSTLNQLYPVPIPTDCTESTWVSGYIPILALDPHGNPRITFVAQHFTSGIHRSDGRKCDGKVDVVWARFSMFPQP